MQITFMNPENYSELISLQQLTAFTDEILLHLRLFHFVPYPAMEKKKIKKLTPREIMDLSRIKFI